MNDDMLKLSNQLCFPLYAATKKLVNHYNFILAKINLTYTQYIAMMVLWECKAISVKELGERLHLDSGTLTPLLKRLEIKGFITRSRSKEDERSVNITITQAGEALKSEAMQIPLQIVKCLPFTEQESQAFYTLLYKLLNKMD